MLEKENKKIDEGKTQKRRGRLFAPQNKLVRGGVQKAKAFDTQELNFVPPGDVLGLAGQFSLDNVDESGNATIDMIVLGVAGEFRLVGAIIPAVDAGGIGGGSVLGSAARAYGYVRSYFYSTASDRRLKKEIKDIAYGLDTVNKLRPVSYKFKKGIQDTKLGFIAQELKEHLPEVVDGGEDTTYGVSYDELVPVLVKAVQELSTEVKELKDKML